MTISARTKTFILALLLCGCTYAAAQTSPAMSGYTPSQSGMESVATSSSVVGQAGAEQNPFQGSVPRGPVQPGILPLSLTDAIERGLRYNLGLLLSDQATLQARGARITALSRLLPKISAGSSETSEQINLKALGFPNFPGIPPIIGPFSVFDVRGYFDQPILNLQDLHQERAESDNAKAAHYTYQNARDLVVLVAANLYLEAVSGSSRVEASKAEVKTAQAIYDRAVDMKQAGMVPGIDVLRSQVELQAEEQRLIYLDNQFQTEKLTLARAIGLPVAQKFGLTSKVPYTPLPRMTLDQALARALATRADYKSLLAQVHAAESIKKAARSEALPYLNFHADYGDIGPSPGNSHGTYTVEANLKVPLFQGGKVRGDVMQADALLQQRESELKDLRNKIAYQVRTAFLDLKSSEDQVRVARSTQLLAHETLREARDRFAAGVVNSLEVVQAQQAVATADENYISSLYGYNLAKASLARALGLAEVAFKEMMGGNR
ncbi:MAG: TolC family protein [Acidobacteria bacterium]|nr:TolC family protein [Acidobacteriota bacterium]